MRGHNPKGGELRTFVATHANLDPPDSIAAEAERLLDRAERAGITSTKNSIAQALYVLRRAPRAKVKRVAKARRRANGALHVAGATGVQLVTLDDLRTRLQTLMATVSTAGTEAIAIIDTIAAQSEARRARMAELRQQLSDEGLVS